MITRLASLCLVCLAIAACGGNNGDDTPPGDDNPPADAQPNDPDAPPGNPPDARIDAPPAACANIAGSWGISGSCGSDVCTFTQVGCSITQVTCTSGAQSTSGALDGNDFTYTGTSGAGVPATCDGTITGDAFSGTCDVAGLGTCDFSGTRL
jgi:hypothetical protein